MKKKISLILLCILMLFSLTSCNNNKSNDVVILFTNDVHCGIDENIGYSGLSSYKKEMEEQYENVVLVDCGDFLQGSYEGTVSKGLYLTEIMNAVGYDFVIFGNHEFDYGMEARDVLTRPIEAGASCSREVAFSVSTGYPRVPRGSF